MEIGVLYGPGICSMAVGAKLGGKGKVIALDHVNRDEILNSDDFFTRHNFLRYGPGQLFQLFYNAFLLDVADHIILITEDSMIAHQWLDVPLRLLHVDANHDYKHVKNDICFYGNMIIPGGYICCGNSLENGCRHAVEEFVRDSGKYEDFHRPIDGFAVARKI